MRPLPLFCAASLLSLAIACGGGDGASDPGGGDGTGAGGSNGAGTSDPGNPKSVDLSGHYELSSHYDLTTAGVLPDVANETLQALADLKTNPSKTIIELLQAAKVPIVSTLLGLIPDPLEGPFEGWFNDNVFKAVYQDAPVTKKITDLIGDIAAIATQFEVVSSLDLPKTDDLGNATAKHALTGVAFTIGGQRTLVQVPALLGPFTTADHVDASAVHIVERSPEVENGRLSVGDHAFGVPIGDFVLVGVDKIAQATLGAATLRDALGKVIDCETIAADVASKCIGPLCVGHKAEIAQLCDAGLDQIASQIHDRLHGISLNAVHLAAGQARMWDAPTPDGALDGKIDRIDHGEWTAFVRVSLTSEHPIAATFTGTRVGDGAGAPPPPPSTK